MMWLMALWPRRRVWRSPSTDKVPSSRRVRLLYDRFLERETEAETDVCVCVRGGADGEEERKEMGGRRRNVLCEVWKEKTGWQNSEAPCNVIGRNLIADSVAYLPLSDVFFHLALFFTTRCQQRMGSADHTAQVRSQTFDREEKSFWVGTFMSTTSTSNPT